MSRPTIVIKKASPRSIAAAKKRLAIKFGASKPAKNAADLRKETRIRKRKMRVKELEKNKASKALVISGKAKDITPHVTPLQQVHTNNEPAEEKQYYDGSTPERSHGAVDAHAKHLMSELRKENPSKIQVAHHADQILRHAKPVIANLDYHNERKNLRLDDDIARVKSAGFGHHAEKNSIENERMILNKGTRDAKAHISKHVALALSLHPHIKSGDHAALEIHHTGLDINHPEFAGVRKKFDIPEKKKIEEAPKPSVETKSSGLFGKIKKSLFGEERSVENRPSEEGTDELKDKFANGTPGQGKKISIIRGALKEYFLAETLPVQKGKRGVNFRTRKRLKHGIGRKRKIDLTKKSIDHSGLEVSKHQRKVGISAQKRMKNYSHEQERNIYKK